MKECDERAGRNEKFFIPIRLFSSQNVYYKNFCVKDVFTNVIVYDNLILGGNNIFKVDFYQRENGKVPVHDFLLSLNPKLRAKAFSDIELLKKHGCELKEPYVKPIKGKRMKGLYELRIKFSTDNVRIFYFTFQNNKYILLHGFLKRTMKTPSKELEKALRYMEDYTRRASDE